MSRNLKHSLRFLSYKKVETIVPIILRIIIWLARLICSQEMPSRHPINSNKTQIQINKTSIFTFNLDKNVRCNIVRINSSKDCCSERLNRKNVNNLSGQLDSE